MKTTPFKMPQDAPEAAGRCVHTIRRLIAGLQWCCKRRFAGLLGFSTPILANNRQNGDAAVALTNSFTVLQDNWVQLSPLGDFINVGPRDKNGRPKFPQGVIQRVDPASVDAMVSAFNEAKASKGADFGGLPWFVGHPDVDPDNNPDKGAYGWIMALRNGGDQGLLGQVKWTAEGQELKDGGKYKYFSPCWFFEDAATIANGKPVMKPDELVSVGFTNTPQIPVKPLSNERQALPNYGTSAGAKKGWETRRANATNKEKAAAKAGAKGGSPKGKLKWEKRETSAQNGTPIAATSGKYEIHKGSGGRYAAQLADRPGQPLGPYVKSITDAKGQAEAHLAASEAGKDAVRAASAALAPSKPKGFLSSLIHAFKNPSAHSGDALGN
jgi:hypothetical protein